MTNKFCAIANFFYNFHGDKFPITQKSIGIYDRILILSQMILGT